MRVYQDITRLFHGDYPGYRKCNTAYHDWRHTEDCLLATVRLIHGAQLNGCHFSERGVSLGIIAAIMHDTGYIQKWADQEGTGAKYTLIHVERSIDFLETYFADRGHAQKDFHFCRDCVKCTGVDVEIKQIQFESLENDFWVSDCPGGRRPSCRTRSSSSFLRNILSNMSTSKRGNYIRQERSHTRS